MTLKSASSKLTNPADNVAKADNAQCQKFDSDIERVNFLSSDDEEIAGLAPNSSDDENYTKTKTKRRVKKVNKEEAKKVKTELTVTEI